MLCFALSKCRGPTSIRRLSALPGRGVAAVLTWRARRHRAVTQPCQLTQAFPVCSGSTGMRQVTACLLQGLRDYGYRSKGAVCLLRAPPP